MKTTRKKAAKLAVKKFLNQQWAWSVANIESLVIHVMKAEHARHARGNVCVRKKIPGGKIIKVKVAGND